MTADNGNHPDGLAPIVRKLEELAEQLDAEIAATRARLEVQLAESRKLQAMIRAATAQPGKPGPRRQRAPESKIGAAKLNEVMAAIRAIGKDVTPDVPGSFSSNFVQEQTSLPKSIVDVALRALREQGRIRLIGERKLGARGRSSKVYVITDTDES